MNPIAFDKIFLLEISVQFNLQSRLVKATFKI